MTKTTIINVDIGDIDEIISKNITELAGKSKQILSEAIETQRRIQNEKERREEEKKKESDKTIEIMESIHDRLESAMPDGIPVDEILELSKGIIPNASALTLRIKTMLRHQDHKYRLERKKINGVPTYLFQPFSIEE